MQSRVCKSGTCYLRNLRVRTGILDCLGCGRRLDVVFDDETNDILLGILNDALSRRRK